MPDFKTYHAFMDEISSKDIYTGLLGQGLFSEKLPPIFTSKEFCNFCLNNHPNFPEKEMGYVFYENMRNINIPRPLGIPNPVAYHHLCQAISDNWDKLQAYFKTQTENQSYKISRIHIRKRLGSSKLFEMNYSNWKIDGSPEPDLLIGMRYMVNADISNCFPSIYSHSLSWALVGKDVAKQNRNNHNEWYNKLDFYTRNIKRGETHGLLIGPHASNLLSEIILTKVDKALYDKGFRFIRNIDDYTCYTQSYEKAQDFLLKLSAYLRYFDLTLNHKKTKISELPIASTEQWVRKINTFSSFDMKDKMDYKDVQAYIDLALELMTQNSENAAILKYAIKVLANKKLTDNAKQYLVKTVLHLCIIYPYIIPMLEEFIFIPYGVNSDKIKHISQLIYNEGLFAQNYEAVSFSIYFAIKYNFLLEKISFDEMKNSNNAVCLLMAYLYTKKNGKTSDIKPYKEYAKELANNEDNFNSFWVFIYECLPKSYLKDYWKNLKNNGVTFVNI